MHIGNRLVALTGLAIAGCGAPPVGQTTPSNTLKALTVTSPDFREGSSIPDKFSSYFENATPTIRWTAGPSGTQSYVLLVEDPDAPGSKPFVHWLVTNIPNKTLSQPSKGVTGKNENGETAYYGPHPPAGAAHRYLFQVFALDLLSLSSNDRDGLTKEISGHVVAKGVLQGLYAKK